MLIKDVASRHCRKRDFCLFHDNPEDTAKFGTLLPLKKIKSTIRFGRYIVSGASLFRQHPFALTDSQYVKIRRLTFLFFADRNSRQEELEASKDCGFFF